MTAPAPLTPPEADLQDFPFMPLHVARLRDSDLAAEGEPEANWYAVLLWAASWHQLPAGSLPDNDTVLMRIVGLGRDVKTWARHKAGALRGFVHCSDGRLYHPIVAEQVNTAWSEKLAYRERKEKRVEAARMAAAARWGEQSQCDADATGMSNGCDPHTATMRNALPTDAHRMPDAMPKGTGTGTGRIKKKDSLQPTTQNAAREIDDPVLDRVLDAAGFKPGEAKRRAAAAELAGWLDEKFDLELDILPAIAAFIREKPGTTNSLKRFSAAIRSAHRHRVAQPALTAPKPIDPQRERLKTELQAAECESCRTIRAAFAEAYAGRAERFLADAVLRFADGWLLSICLPFQHLADSAQEVMPMASAVAEKAHGSRVRVVFEGRWPALPQPAPIAAEAGCA
jgi:hypothetical protein